MWAGLRWSVCLYSCCGHFQLFKQRDGRITDSRDLSVSLHPAVLLSIECTQQPAGNQSVTRPASAVCLCEINKTFACFFEPVTFHDGQHKPEAFLCACFHRFYSDIFQVRRYTDTSANNRYRLLKATVGSLKTADDQPVNQKRNGNCNKFLLCIYKMLRNATCYFFNSHYMN